MYRSRGLGDSLRRSIEVGLAQSRFAVIILSQSFFTKEWPQRELDGLVARGIKGEKVTLPVWHDISKGGLFAKIGVVWSVGSLTNKFVRSGLETRYRLGDEPTGPY